MNIKAVTAIQSPISESHSCWWRARCSRWPRNKNIQNSASRNQSVRTRSSWKQNVNKQTVAKVVIFCPQSEKCTLHIMRFPSVHLNSTYSHFPIKYPNKMFKQPEKLATEDAAKKWPTPIWCGRFALCCCKIYLIPKKLSAKNLLKLSLKGLPVQQIVFHSHCIVGKKRDPGILDPEFFLAQIRKVEARLWKLAKTRKSVIN